MKPATSIYLNLVRFCAAAVVFIGHTSGQLFTGGFLWQAGGYMRTAVIVFFVLSGYVIAHVMATRENSLLLYTASRFGRIFSIVIPALLLTAFCDYIGLQKDPVFYYNGPWGYPTDNVVWRYIVTLLLVNRWWVFSEGGLEPGVNVPFWSLSFEAAYYCAIAIVVFGRKRFRIFIFLLILALLAGPSVAILAPLWFFGYLIYYAPKYWKISFSSALCLLIGGAILLFMSSKLRQQPYFNSGILGVNSVVFPADYYDGIAFAVHLVGFNAVADRAERFLRPFAQLFAWLGSLTFALYLFHRPLIQVLAVYPVGEPRSWQERLWVLGGTFLVVATIGRICELQKGAYRRAFVAVVHRFRNAVGGRRSAVTIQN